MPMVFEYDKGVSNQDEGRTPQGFVTFMQNWIYDPDDRDRVFKIFGRTSAGAFPSAATAANTKGFDYLQYDNNINKLVVCANASLYTQTIVPNGGTVAPALSGGWTQITDKAASPAAFPRNGNFLKVLPSGDNRYICFTGYDGERPLIRDEDGDWHYLGMNKPDAVTLAAVSSAAQITRASGTPTNPTTSDFGTVDAGGFANTANAYDGDATTYASKGLFLTQGGAIRRAGTIWKFAAASTTSGAQKLFVTLAISGLPPGNENIGGFEGGTEPAVANVYVQVSINGGSTWTTIFTGSSPLSNTTVSYDVASGVTWTNIWVQVIFEYVTGTSASVAYVYDIWAQTASTAGSALIDAGTYYYAQTEVYQVTLSSGKTIYVESPPSDPRSVAIAASASYGVTVTFSGTQTNALTDGYKHDTANKRLLFRKIYRSTKTGTWPDLGYIGQAAIDATTFIDTFAITGTTLGTPGINVVYAGVAALNASGPAPDFYDAVQFRSAIVAIPAQDPYRIQWSLPGFPDYWPLPAHDLGTLPSIRNDQLRGVSAVGEYLLLFTRTRVLRMRDLPFVDRPNFDIGRIQVDILSPNEGLAGSPLSHCTAQSQKGYSTVVWVSDSGIWMTDGSLPSEGGLGIVKLTSNINWRRLVDVSQLLTSKLVYDPILQILFFDYTDINGNRRTLCLHTAPYHWVNSDQDHTVPKVSGPHTRAPLVRCVGELGGTIFHWSLNTADLLVHTERFGETDNGQPITSVLETGWQQPAGPQEEFLATYGSLYHSHWGPSETCNLDLLARRDDTGVIQEARKTGVNLAGASVTNFYMHKAGKSFRLRLTHTGRTTSTGRDPIKALGPTAFDGEQMDALFGV